MSGLIILVIQCVAVVCVFDHDICRCVSRRNNRPGLGGGVPVIAAVDLDSGYFHRQWQGLYSFGQYAGILDVQSRMDVIDQHLMLRFFLVFGWGVVPSGLLYCALTGSALQFRSRLTTVRSQPATY